MDPDPDPNLEKIETASESDFMKSLITKIGFFYIPLLLPHNFFWLITQEI